MCQINGTCRPEEWNNKKGEIEEARDGAARAPHNELHLAASLSRQIPAHFTAARAE